MICPECKGERAVYRCFQNRITLTPCPKCNGVGEVVHTNFDRITASPEKLAEFIADAMFLYSTNRHIFTVEAVKMASKKEGIDINLDCIYKDVVKWLNEESEMRRVSDDQKETEKETEKDIKETEVVSQAMGQ